MKHDLARAWRYRAQAASLIELATTAKTRATRAEYLRLADEYGELVEQLEAEFGGKFPLES